MSDPGQAGRVASVVMGMIALVLAVRAAVRLTHGWGDWGVGRLMLEVAGVLIVVAVAVAAWRPRRW